MREAGGTESDMASEKDLLRLVQNSLVPGSMELSFKPDTNGKVIYMRVSSKIKSSTEKASCIILMARNMKENGSTINMKAKAKPEIFKQLRIIKLDEWGGVPEMHPVTCEYFLQNSQRGLVEV